MPPKNTPLKKAIIILLIIAILLTSLFAAGALTDWFGYYGPGGKLMTASALALASGNFTLQIDASVGSFDTDTTLVKVDADLPRQEVSIAAMSGSGIISWAIYDSHLIWRSGLRYQAKDISAQLDKLWNSTDTGKQPDWEQLIREVSEELAQKLDGVIDYSQITGSLGRLYKRSNDTRWLKEHAGLQMQKKLGSTSYQIEPDNYEVLREAASCFQSIFFDPQDYQALQDTLSGYQPQLDALHYQVHITTRWGILSQCRLETVINGKDVRLQLQILDRGMTQLPQQELSELLSGLTDR